MLQTRSQRFQQEEGLLTDNSRFSHLSSKSRGECSRHDQNRASVALGAIHSTALQASV